ncbi:MAG: hypothetical protein NVSMB9_10030 [Isosphaeraceae bacterium]
MNTTSPATKDLARRLIAFEATRNPSDGPVGATLRACEALRGLLAKFVGLAGFRSLLSRALAMAKAENPSLGSVQVQPDGLLKGLEEVEQNQDGDAGAVVVAQLLGLLVAFIGEPLMLRLVWDAWPDATEAETDGIGEGQS